MKVVQSLGVSILVLALGVGPAIADSVHIGGTTNITNQGGQGGAGGNAAASAAASASSNPVQVNTQVTTQGQQQGQSQTQGQQQGQIQGQGQGQKQQANNEGNHQDVKFEAPLIPGVAVAPGLTSVGTYACLGSISFGLSGPMAGASFGITKVDTGCEHARDAVILMGWGYPQAAMILLSKNADTLDALQRDTKARELLKTTAAGPIPDLKLSTPLGSEVKPATFGAPLTAAEYAKRSDTPSPCGKDMVVTPSGFCAWAK